MRIPQSKIKRYLSEIAEIQPKPRRRLIGKMIASLRADLASEADKHMQPCVVLLDESLRVCIDLQRFLFSKTPIPEHRSALAQLVSRLRSDVLGIREMILLGQEAPAAVLARAMVETIELAMACAIDAKFSAAYSGEDSSAFWAKEIGYGRIVPRVKAFLLAAGGSQESADDYVLRRRAVKAALSGHVHPAQYSAFRSVAVPSISHPGMFHFGQLGALGIHLPRLSLTTANEVWQFAEALISLLTKPDRPASLANLGAPLPFADMVASTYVLRRLMEEYGEVVDAHHGQVFNAE